MGVSYAGIRSKNGNFIPSLPHSHVWINFMKVKIKTKSKMILAKIKSNLEVGF